MIVDNRILISKQLGKLIKETTHAPDWLCAMSDECIQNNIPVVTLCTVDTCMNGQLTLADKRLT